MREDKRVMRVEELAKFTSITDHPTVRAVAVELEKVTAEQDRAARVLVEAEVSKQKAWDLAVEAMARGEPAPEEFRRARVVVEAAQEGVALADLALAAVQQRKAEAIAQAKQEVAAALRGEHAQAVFDLDRAFGPVMERNERVRELWNIAQQLLGNEQSAVPRLFWRELIPPEGFPESRIGFWRNYIKQYYAWIRLDGRSG